MAQLIGSSSGLGQALAMRRRVGSLEMAAHAMTHWHAVAQLYAETRHRVQDEQHAQVLQQQFIAESKPSDSKVHKGPGKGAGGKVCCVLWVS